MLENAPSAQFVVAVVADSVSFIVTVTFCASVNAVIVALPPGKLTSRPTSVAAKRFVDATSATPVPLFAFGFSVVVVVLTSR